MAHDDKRLLDFLAGDLDEGAAERFDRHLIGCDQCWQAVIADRRGRAAAEGLRELAPPGLGDRVRLAVSLAIHPPRSHRRAVRGAATAAVIAVIVALAVTVPGRHGERDPAAVAAVVLAARSAPGSAPTVEPSAAGQRMEFSRVRAGGQDVVVARSDRPFPMPSGARTLTAASTNLWVARRGELTVVCVNWPTPLLLASRLPADQLLDVALQQEQ